MREIKKQWIIAAVIMVLGIACLCACGEEENASDEPETFELALITDEVGVRDGSFHETTWNAMQAFAEENEMTCRYYESEDTGEAYLKTIRKARRGGAKLIVLAGSQFETVIYQAQKKYEDIYFVLLDGVPRDEDYNYDTAANSIGVLFAEQEAGYLAGYAAVCEGYTRIGFMGGDELPPVKRYCYGFVQGVSAACKEKNAGDIDLKYTYLGTFEASDEIESESYEWYQEGTEVIFACGGSIGESVMAAAETTGKAVIGVDTDQSGMSETVITSAKKEIGKAVTDILKNYKRNNFGGGAIMNYSAENNGIGLEMTNARLTVFDEEAYQTLYRQIQSGEREIVKDIGEKGLETLADEKVHVEKVKE